MAERRQMGKVPPVPGQTHPPPLTREQFEKTPQFRRFRRGMKALLKVSKVELDKRIEGAKQDSPRRGNPKAPGQKRRISRPHDESFPI